MMKILHGKIVVRQGYSSVAQLESARGGILAEIGPTLIHRS